MPKEVQKYPKPTKILSRGNLFASWKQSRDCTRQAGSRGSDGVSARAFAANLDNNLRRLAREIRSGEFRFSKLKPCPVVKPGSDKERLICIPAVRDRVVQRRISTYLYDKKLLPIYHPSSFGFIPGEGVKKAISTTIDYRDRFDYCFETDIVGFFDNIDRERLISRLTRALGRHSLVPLICQAIQVEVGSNAECSDSRLERMGIVKGLGIRQGMPLSPILSNLALSDFDRAVQERGIPLIRYADDIVAFAPTRDEALRHGEFIRNELAKLKHTIPELGSAKTKLVTKGAPLTFLGRDIQFNDHAGRFVQRVSDHKLKSIVTKIRNDLHLQNLLKSNGTVLDATKYILQTVASYVNCYSDAYNAQHVENELRAAAKKAIQAIYKEIFGSDSIDRVSKRYAKFLGFETLDLNVSETIDLY